MGARRHPRPDRSPIVVVLLAALAVTGACAGEEPPSAGPGASDPPATTVTTSAPAPTVPTAPAPAPPGTMPPSTSPPGPGSGALPLAGRTIVLDPGHNGRNHAHQQEISRLVDIGTGTKPCNTTGTATDAGYPESRFTWQVALVARPALEALGAEVELTRADDEGWGPCIDERAAIGNRAGADAVISIHADGGPPEARGFHIIHPAVLPGLTDDVAEPSARLAVLLREAYRRTGIPVATYRGENGLSVRDDLGGLNLSDVPVVFLEAGNLRNATDAALLVSAGFQGEVAAAIVAALVEFLPPGSG